VRSLNMYGRDTGITGPKRARIILKLRLKDKKIPFWIIVSIDSRCIEDELTEMAPWTFLHHRTRACLRSKCSSPDDVHFFRLDLIWNRF
jgi:hypothetical protein